MEIDARNVLDVIREYRDEADPSVRFGMYYALVILDLVGQCPPDCEHWLQAERAAQLADH